MNTSKADIDLLGADQSNVYALSSISGGKHKVRQGSDGKVYIETSSDALPYMKSRMFDNHWMQEG